MVITWMHESVTQVTRCTFPWCATGRVQAQSECTWNCDSQKWGALLGQKEEPSRTKINYKTDTQFLLFWTVFSFSTLKKRVHCRTKSPYIHLKFSSKLFPFSIRKKILPGFLVKRKLCRVLWSSPVSPGWEGAQAGPFPFLQLQSAELPSSHQQWSLGPCPTEISERYMSVPQVVAILPLLGAGERGVFKNKTDIWKNLWFQL